MGPLSACDDHPEEQQQQQGQVTEYAIARRFLVIIVVGCRIRNILSKDYDGFSRDVITLVV